MFVDQGVEGHPVPPAGGEVVDVDVGIPEQEVRGDEQLRIDSDYSTETGSTS